MHSPWPNRGPRSGSEPLGRPSSLALDSEDRARLAEACAATTPLPGDCGDEYRKPPFLTASGDLSHHLDAMAPANPAEPVPHRDGARRVLSGSDWEEIAGYCRAQRIGERILVSGTTATAGAARAVAPEDAEAQTTYILDKILAALAEVNDGWTPGYGADDVTARMAAQVAEKLDDLDAAKDWAERGLQRARNAGDAHAQGELQAFLDDL